MVVGPIKCKLVWSAAGMKPLKEIIVTYGSHAEMVRPSRLSCAQSSCTDPGIKMVQTAVGSVNATPGGTEARVARTLAAQVQYMCKRGGINQKLDS
jgi:hypothetical protein